MQVRRIQINTNSNKPVTQISSRMAWIPVSKAESGSKCVHCDQLIHQIVQKQSQTKQAFIEIMWMVLNSAYLALHVEKKLHFARICHFCLFKNSMQQEGFQLYFIH